jgi:branched-chain amino acid transport system substrate-binding protein
MWRRILNIVTTILVALALASPARAEETIKIGLTTGLSGPFAQIGQAAVQDTQYILDSLNAKGGALGKKFGFVAYDNKFQPSEALLALESIADQNIPFLLHGNGSNLAAALIDAVDKHNARNPDNQVLYLNFGAVATEFTNERCNFWHFRFDVNAEQKVLMLVRALPVDVKKVYLLNQDYLFGQDVQRTSVRYLAQERPDIAIGGNELIPLFKVKDFAPYISKVKASGAQAIVTGNFGPDLSLLIKAGTDAGLDVKYYTLYAYLAGSATAIGPVGDGRVLTLQAFNANAVDATDDDEAKQWAARFYASHDFDIFGPEITALESLQAAIAKAGSTNPLKVAQALEGMAGKDMLGHEVVMRAEDHQILMPYYVSVFSKDVKYDSEHTGLGWKVVKTYEAKDLALPTTCKMKRPES